MTYLSFITSIFLALAVSVPADAPSEQEKIGLEILLTVSTALGDCEGIRLDLNRIESVANDYGVKQSDVTGRYKAFSIAYASDLMKAAGNDPVRFCVYALGTFGPHGSIPGLIIRR